MWQKSSLEILVHVQNSNIEKMYLCTQHFRNLDGCYPNTTCCWVDQNSLWGFITVKYDQQNESVDFLAYLPFSESSKVNKTPNNRWEYNIRSHDILN